MNDDSDAVIALMIRAARVRRAVEAELRRYGLSFSLWRVLHATSQLSEQARDAVSQYEIALATGLSKSTVSSLVGVLLERGLVDCGADGLAWAYRIWPTPKGRALLETSRPALAAGLALARANPWVASAALEHCRAKSEIDV